MSAIGDYVHLSAKGYLDSGTSWGRDKTKKPASSSLFIWHKEHIQARASLLKKPNLKQMEDQYNKDSKDIFNLISDGLSTLNATQKRDFFYGIARAAHFSKAEAALIADKMEMDERRGFIYKPDTASSNAFRTGRLTIPLFQDSHKVTKQNNTKEIQTVYHYVKTIIARVEDAIVKVKALDSVDNSLKNQVIKDLEDVKK